MAQLKTGFSLILVRLYSKYLAEHWHYRGRDSRRLVGDLQEGRSTSIQGDVDPIMVEKHVFYHNTIRAANP